MRKFVLLTIVTLVALLTLQPAQSATREEARLESATRVLNELLNTPDQNVPHWLLDRAYAVAVIPQVIKVGLVAGGRRGKGALVVRGKDGTWSQPIFVNLTGGSFGFQFGVQSADVVLVFTSKAGIEGIVGGKVTLGADAAVAAGPVGRQTSAATDVGLNAQVYSYSRASGLFAGVALDGSALTIDDRSNEVFYKRPGVLASELLNGDVTTQSETADQFVAAVERSGGAPMRAATAQPEQQQQPESPTTAGATTTPAPPIDEGAITTQPMEDPSPGEEPPL